MARSLGIASAEFWEMTPREFHAITERNRERDEVEWMRCGALQATLANLQRDPSKRPEAWTAYDFLPAHMDHREEPREPGQEDMLRAMRELNAAFGGEDLTRTNG